MESFQGFCASSAVKPGFANVPERLLFLRPFQAPLPIFPFFLRRGTFSPSENFLPKRPVRSDFRKKKPEPSRVFPNRLFRRNSIREKATVVAVSALNFPSEAKDAFQSSEGGVFSLSFLRLFPKPNLRFPVLPRGVFSFSACFAVPFCGSRFPPFPFVPRKGIFPSSKNLPLRFFRAPGFSLFVILGSVHKITACEPASSVDFSFRASSSAGIRPGGAVATRRIV